MNKKNDATYATRVTFNSCSTNIYSHFYYIHLMNIDM